MPARKPTTTTTRRQSPVSELGAMFAQRLKDERVAKDWSQTELAEASGVNVTFISELERGRKEASLATIERLAAALDVTPAAMLTPPTKSKK